MSIDSAIKNAVASLNIEGYQVDNKCIIWCEQLLRNEINMEEYINLVKQNSGVNA